MKETFKKYCSIIFLFLFLFPLVEKEIHAIEHADDVHCSASDKHFHELEHSCSICDYTFSSSADLISPLCFAVDNGKSFVFNPFIVEHVSIEFNYLLPSRAPPVV
jgi:hypothetical protein